MKQATSLIFRCIVGVGWLALTAGLVNAQAAGQAIQCGFLAVMALMIVMGTGHRQP